MWLPILVCLLFQQTAVESKDTAQTEVNLQKLKQQAQELGDAMISGNYDRAADLTYPELIKLMGGRAKFIATVDKVKTETEGSQFRILSVTIGEPQDIEEQNRRHYAIVPTTMRIKVPEGTLVGEAFMIGISADGGQNWTFVDSGGKPTSRAHLRTLLGSVVDKLRIPKYKRPVLYPQ